MARKQEQAVLPDVRFEAVTFVVLQASSDGPLDGLEARDSVRVDYVEASAIRITRDGAPVR